MKAYDANRRAVLLDNNNNESIAICEAVNCYEAATGTIIVYAGKFGSINLNLCHKCAVTKFQSTIERIQRNESVPIESKLYERSEVTE